MQGGSSGPPVASFPGLPDALSSPPAQRTGLMPLLQALLKQNQIVLIQSAPPAFPRPYLSTCGSQNPAHQPSLSLQCLSLLLEGMILTPCPQCLHCSAPIHFASLDLNVTSPGSLPLFAKVIGLLVPSALSIVWLPIRSASQLRSSRSLYHIGLSTSELEVS